MSWREIALGSAIHVKHGYAFKGDLFVDHGEFIVLTPGNFNEEGGFRIRPAKDRAYAGDIPEAYVLDENDLLVAMTEQGAGLLGSAALVPQGNRYLHNQRLGLVDQIDASVLDKRFLYLLFNTRSVRSQISGSASGTKVRHTAPERIYRVRARVPDLSTQAAIAETILSYDDLIQNNRRRMALLEESVRLLYREWFIRLRFPGYEHTLIADGVPQGWARRSAFDSMQVLSGGTPKTTMPDYWDGETPFFTPKDATDGIWVSACERSVSELGIKNCNSKLYPRETVFITARGTVGKLNMAQVPMAMSQSCYALVGKDHLSQRFVYSAMEAGVDALRQQAVGAVFDAIVVDTFKRIKLMVPPVPMLRLFDEAVTSVFDQVENLASQNQKLRTARDLLLPRLMSGELAV
ncbi:restriction endonuclease subunit S [Polaromonas sp. YR568]|uniref:restriction endonuclease subunit S n=1 Tax=Polaromonas sp. YR568 TaxID=1855301 RepID=UPI003137B28A